MGKYGEDYSQECRGRKEPLDDPFEPYDVTCARCGKVLPCDEAYVEEGDEWECPECWERCEAAERAGHNSDPATP